MLVVLLGPGNVPKYDHFTSYSGGPVKVTFGDQVFKNTPKTWRQEKRWIGHQIAFMTWFSLQKKKKIFENMYHKQGKLGQGSNF